MSSLGKMEFLNDFNHYLWLAKVKSAFCINPPSCGWTIFFAWWSIFSVLYSPTVVGRGRNQEPLKVHSRTQHSKKNRNVLIFQDFFYEGKYVNGIKKNVVLFFGATKSIIASIKHHARTLPNSKFRTMIRILITTAISTAVAVSAFSPSQPRRLATTTSSRSSGSHHVPTVAHPSPRYSSENPLEGMSEERRSNLFQSLLRDLQIEGVPLLGCGEFLNCCRFSLVRWRRPRRGSYSSKYPSMISTPPPDANQVHTLNAALWTTMAEMSDADSEQRACLILEDIPISALLAFAEDFTVLKTQQRLMEHLPEFKRFSISPLGKGVGPALLIETEERSEEEKAKAAERKAFEGSIDKDKTIAALKSFIDRVVVGMEACPYTKSVDISAVGLESRGISPGPVGYRFSSSMDACQVMSAFWNCICELMGEDETKLSSIM